MKIGINININININRCKIKAEYYRLITNCAFVISFQIQLFISLITFWTEDTYMEITDFIMNSQFLLRFNVHIFMKYLYYQLLIILLIYSNSNNYYFSLLFIF